MNRSTLRRRATPPAVVLTLALALAACGGNEPAGNAAPGNTSAPQATSGDTGGGSAELSGTLSGAGASSQTAAMQAWQAGFQEQNPDVTVNYDPVGSGGGREQFIAGGTVFAGSDAYLDDEELTAAEERCNGAGVVELPHYISPIAVAYNLEGVDALNLSPDTVAGIFSEKITAWNDPAIAKDNPDAQLPDTKITPVHRSDESGTTENFVEYLAAAAPDAWTFEVSGDWPGELGGEAASGTSGVVQAIGAGNGTIGYADASQVGDLGSAAIGVGGEFVDYSPEAAAKVLESSERVSGRGENDIAIDVARDTTESGTYPIVLVSYHIACQQYSEQQEADLVKAFLGYVASDEGQQAAAEAAGSAPISPTLQEDSMAAIESITAG